MEMHMHDIIIRLDTEILTTSCIIFVQAKLMG